MKKKNIGRRIFFLKAVRETQTKREEETERRKNTLNFPFKSKVYNVLVTKLLATHSLNKEIKTSSHTLQFTNL